ncbi:HAMP domain-containing sensor histidine kinase [Fructobacillus evanidus]|uniref:histidine kinase n=1 Tax=Fructobacillus evanidus TaxID=3064281 RepID=A0ABM9MT71_9LACO|nr:K+-sensing histidine kinase KdpD (KdpD) [Fructobacillus sp. LMG 32999]CAK1234408.1 K+-sensing histidine kinase KdpD (KdpD) [Fructobacillus sp. LMG 32999]CAK1235296.1 K+-sensing histidine kinase KdpD (KdpD) [Fructobacillus sp. LMG 32999]CAK1236023.1 K+-sensing histidine kinase KdpD (KdpD) [Fructobacillus sp. LMG 32999]CAK1238019.1 K+-sensing histidine kinase KdpD (KdpD) [Fructobacillus sp. LMG 32999]
MPRLINRKQQIDNFSTLALGLMVIFGFLAGVIFWVYTFTIYDSSDKVINQYVEYYQRNNWLDEGASAKQKMLTADSMRHMPEDFRGNFLYYDDKGKEIENQTNNNGSKNVLTRRFGLKFDTSDLNLAPRTVHVNKTYLRIQAVKFKPNTVLVPDGQGLKSATYGYVFVDVTDTVLNLKKFQDVMVWSFVSAFIFALFFAFFIARQSMKPILKAWDQQQDFVNNAAHELRTPMSVIQGKLETMLTKPDNTIRQQSEAIILSLSEVRRLNSLTNNMLTLAKTGSNMTKIEKEKTDVGQFLKQILSPYVEMGEISDKKVVIHNAVRQEVDIDQKRIHQLLVLLMDNALKYSDDGAIVTVSAAIEKKRLALSVADTGRGISADAKKHIFDRFYREDKTGNRETGGTGLGLSIAEWIVAAHNGKITVSDNEPKGTIFKVTLPL